LLTTYDKQHLVPGLEADMTPGKEFVTQEIAGVRYGLAICKDMHFPTLGRAYGRARVDAMLIPAWDFERDAWMAARMTALRGIESGYAVIRSSREGLLTVSDRFGRFAAERRSAPVPGAWLLTSAPLEHVEETLYAEWGDVFGWTCLALAVLMRLPVTGLMLAVRPLPRTNGAEPASASLQD
jgi:apolipoprotein N-acyltransferase